MISQLSLFARRIKRSQWQFIIETLIITAFFCLCFLLEDNMGRVNEVNILPFARQHADPSWIPEDWYYNLPAGYRTPFIAIFGNMASVWGFLITSIVGRFLVFTLLASSLVFLARTLELKLISLLFAMTIFLFSSDDQGLIAEEWLVRALEPKAIAYSLLLIGITFMFRENYRLMALFLGLAISFHVLVGGWALLTVAFWLLLRRSKILKNPQLLISISLIYLIAASFAIPPILRQLFSVTSESGFSASYIYVNLRTPHHLNPLSWSLGQWIQPLIYFIFFAITIAILWKHKNTVQKDSAIFALCAIVPFILGVMIAPWDQQGNFLQYYPFRLGDVMFPLMTCLLFVYILQTAFSQSRFTEKGFIVLCLVILTVTVVIQGKESYDSFITLRQFPSEPQMVTPEWKEMCYWIRENTKPNERFISHPLEEITFTWLSERATVVKYKFVPPVSSAVSEWYNRLNDLSGDIDITEIKEKEELQTALREGYDHLSTQQVLSLMEKYQANYLVTDVNHSLNLKTAHQNSRYILYSNSAFSNS
ncbi:MAG: DUF6798 domain-containing protein [Halothece sp. Uz-M2-17]|nr:DUF6798 domain-containing protein [Halothece sp. Uz-M2-17]